MTLTITAVNPWRVDARIGTKLVAYAIADAFGWGIHKRVDGKVATVQRIDYGTTARRNARIGSRLTAVALKVPDLASPPTPQ